MLANDLNFEIWFKQDDTFDQPYIWINSKILTGDCNFAIDPQATIYAIFWKGMLEEYLRERSYMAEQAGIHDSLKIHHGYIQLNYTSYNDKVEAYLKDLFSTV